MMHIRQIVIFFLLPFLFSCGSSERFSDQEKEAIEEEVKILISNTLKDPNKYEPLFDKYHLGADLANDFLEFYNDRDNTLAWVGLEGVLPEGETLLEGVRLAYLHGLDSNNYPIQKIKVLRKTLFVDSVGADTFLTPCVQLDFAMTATYLSYASHMLSGVISPAKEGLIWVTYPRKKDWSKYLQEALDNDDILGSIEALVPKYGQYNLLKEKLALYRELREREQPSSATPIRLGEEDDSLKMIVLLKERLNLLGDLPDPSIEQSSSKWDESLTDAIESFQERHGIVNDGLLGTETLAALNVSIEDRIKQIILNMERLRWLPESFGEQYVLINIPDYQLRIMKKGKVDLMMRVIVGKVMTETPVFSDTLEYVVFSPTWTVPKSISIKEMLPKIKDDESYFAKNNLMLYENWSPNAKEVDPGDVKWNKVDEENFNFKIVEKPSKHNALGSVKFMFPNSHAIYLHDTPGGHLFDQAERGFSHGCIRVEKPKILSQYLLKENKQDWDIEKISSYMELEAPTTVTLKQKLPIHIVYHSAWVDKENRIHFLKDIYQHDKAQEKAIERKEEKLKKVL